MRTDKIKKRPQDPINRIEYMEELYDKGLKLINCTMKDCDLSFEKSDVEATIASSVDSIKNPASGKIVCQSVGEIIMDDPEAKGEIVISG